MAELSVSLPATRRTAVTARLAEHLWVVTTALGVVLWVLTVHSAEYSRMGALGLVTILSPTYYLGLAVLALGLGVELVRPHVREVRLLCLTVVLIVFMFGTACAVEPTASLTSAWIHDGYVTFLFQHGHPLNGFDAEFSWPGMFSAGAVLVSFMGQTSAAVLLRWFPLAIELLYLPALVAIARASGVGRRAAWLGIAFFYATDWIYQDYFSPQAVNLLFFLCVVAVVLSCWRPVSLAVATRHPKLAQRRASTREALRLRRLLGGDATTDWPVPMVAGSLAVLTLVFLASAISHQLTPYAMVLALCACLLTRRLARPELVAIAFLLAVGWLSLGASNFWIGHLSLIFGSFGQLASSFQQNASGRVTGSASHRLIVDARILITMALFALAAIGTVRRATSSRTIELLAAAPFALLAAQSYGGEGLLRVALLAGPFAGLLAAAAILPTRSGQLRPLVRQLRMGAHGRALLAAAICVVLLCFSVATTVVRGGNDAYETFSVGEVSAATWIYAHTKPGDVIGLVAPYEPLGAEQVGSVGIFVAVPGGSVPLLHTIVPKLLHEQLVGPDGKKHHLQWIMLGNAQEAWGTILGGYPQGWQAAVERGLVRGGWVVAHRWPTATVLRAPVLVVHHRPTSRATTTPRSHTTSRLASPVLTSTDHGGVLAQR